MRTRLSQHLEEMPFLSRIIHFPPLLLASSCVEHYITFFTTRSHSPTPHSINNSFPMIITHLPHGFDSLLEDMDVAVSWQLTWSCQIAVMSPETLHLVCTNWHYAYKHMFHNKQLGHNKFTLGMSTLHYCLLRFLRRLRNFLPCLPITCP